MILKRLGKGKASHAKDAQRPEIRNLVAWPASPSQEKGEGDSRLRGLIPKLAQAEARVGR